MLHLGYGRTCYICATEGHVTFVLQNDMLHLGYGMTCYMRALTGEGRIERQM